VGERKSYDPDTAIIYWDIPYQPGELKVVAYRDGKAVASDSIQSDGEPTAIAALSAERSLKGKYAVAVIPVSIIDADSRLVYGAGNEVTCTINGPGRPVMYPKTTWTTSRTATTAASRPMSRPRPIQEPLK